MELKRELIKCLKNEGDELQEKKVVMLSSDFEKNEESMDEVNMVAEKNIFRAQVIISTSVMDNGINIEDPKLRNMIIIADNKAEFIQMLGRKRRDKQQLKLYIVQQPKDYFAKRQCPVQRRLKIAEEYYMWIREHIEKYLTEKYFEDYQKKYYEIYQNIQKGEVENIMSFAQAICKCEFSFIFQQHILTMQKIANRDIRIEDATSLFLVCDGVIYLNLLSMKNLDNLNLHYQKIIDRFEIEGKDTFVKEQLEWLGKTTEEIDAIIKNSKITEVEKNYNIVMKKLQEIVDVSKDEKEAIDFKKGIADKLLVLVESVDESNPERDKVINAIKKNDRPLSKKNIDFLREYCKLPFYMDVKDKIYTLGLHEV